MLKKITALVLVGVLSVGLVTNLFAAEGGHPVIELDGKKLEVMTNILDGELLLPLRSVSEAAGFNVQWSGEDKKITVSKSGKNITLRVGDNKVTVNDHDTYTSGLVEIIDGRTYVPAEFASDNLGFNVKWDKASDKVILTSVKENPIIVNTKKEVSGTQTLTLNMQYPEIKGLSNLDVQNKINALFEKLASDAKAEAIKVAKERASMLIERDIKAEDYFNYKVKYNQNEILSVVFYNYLYSGGANGITIQSSYTLNLNTGEVYKLKDLLNDKVDYVSIINKEIKKQMSDSGLISHLTSPFESIKSEQDYYLVNDEIVIYFQQDEYFAHVYGTPEFNIDFSTLTPTSTGIATPAPIPTPTAAPTNTLGSGGVKVQFFNQNTSTSTNILYPNFKLVNTGTTTINLSEVN